MLDRLGSRAYIVGPLLKALHLLEAMADLGHPVTLTQIARRQTLPKTTAYRYLQTLSAAGFVFHDPKNDLYEVGPNLLMLARSNVGFHDLTKLVVPHLERLADHFHETANLGIRSGYNVVYLAIVGKRRRPGMEAVVGERHPMISTALGKAILAFLPDAEREMILASPRAAKTDRTMTYDSGLRRQLREVRKSGYALELGETEIEMGCVGTAILNRSGYPVGGLSLTFPERRIETPIVMEAANELRAVATTISQTAAL